MYAALPSRLLLICIAVACATSVLAQAPRVLVFSKTGGFRHTAIVKGVETYRELGREYGWSIDWTEDAGRFSDAGLEDYAAVVFMSTTGDVLDSLQQGAFERFIAAGRGYVGVHAAADTEYEWPWYRGLVGRQFVQHPHHQEGTIYVVDTLFPGMTGFGDSLRLYEEWYEYGEPNADSLRYLYAVDTASYEQAGYKGADQMGAFHPLGWVHEYGGGRAFYTGIGHMDATFDRTDFRDHLAAGLHYAMTGALEMPTPRAVLGLQAAVLTVDNLPAAVAWYERAFETTATHVDDAYAGFEIGGVELGLRLGASAPTIPRAAGGNSDVVTYWRVFDLADSAAWLQSMGADVAGESMDEEVRVTDPWGNVFVLVGRGE